MNVAKPAVPAAASDASPSASAVTTHGISLAIVPLMLFLTALWGINAVFIKVLTLGMTPLMAAGLRGAVGLACLTVYGVYKGESLRFHGWPLFHGVMNALIFAFEFVLFYTGARFTTGGHMSIFINMAPFFVAVSAHYLLPGDRLTWMKGAGLGLAFLGVATLFSNDILVQHAGNWRGDVLVLLGAWLWGATTIYAKRVMVHIMSPFRLIYIQVLVSTPLLIGAGLLFERNWFFNVSAVTVGALLFQGIVVVSFSYVAWTVLLKRFAASALQSFTFLTPVWGVFFGIVLMGDEPQVLMIAGIALVGLGLYLINRPPRRRAAGPA